VPDSLAASSPDASLRHYNKALEQAYEAKLHNVAWLNRMKRVGIPSDNDDSAEVQQIKDARTQLSRRLAAPPGEKIRQIPVAARPRITIDGLLSPAEWERSLPVSIGLNGRKTTLLLCSDGNKLYVACDVPDETTPADFAQFRFYLHVLTSPLIVNERVHVENRMCRALRQTTVTWRGVAPTGDDERWKRYPITDWNIYRHTVGATQCTGHRQYELSLDLAESGLHRGVPFPAFVEVEGPSEKDAHGAFVRRTYWGKLGSQANPVWFLIPSDLGTVAQLSH
jgi:hypothetical protein